LKKLFFGENLLVKIFDFFPNNICAPKALRQNFARKWFSPKCLRMPQNGVWGTWGAVLKKLFLGQNLFVKIFDFLPNNISTTQKHLGKIFVENGFLQNASECPKTVFGAPGEQF